VDFIEPREAKANIHRIFWKDCEETGVTSMNVFGVSYEYTENADSVRLLEEIICYI
jgi:hypothetical protein